MHEAGDVNLAWYCPLNSVELRGEVTGRGKAMTGSRPLRALLIDDHRVLSEGLRQALERDHDLTVVGLATTGAEALALVASTLPDVVVLDLHLPDIPGLTVARLLRARHPGIAILVLTGAEGPSQMTALQEAGVGGYLTKETAVADVAAGIRAVAAGYRVFPTAASGGMPALTKRERQILAALLHGQTSAQIAAAQGIAPRTVAWHIGNLLGKCDVHSMRELLALAWRERFDLER